MAYRILADQSEVAAYAAGLDAKWPVRSEIVDHISHYLTLAPNSASRLPPAQHVVELCCGPGRLAETIVKDHPHIDYTGIDVSGESLRFAEKRVRARGGCVRFIQADLNNDGWWDRIAQPVTAVLTMQSMHDLGDAMAVARMYSIAYSLLAQDGLFLNADLLAYTVVPPDTNPGRLTIEQHLQLLHEANFATGCCTLEKAGFGCVAGWKRT